MRSRLSEHRVPVNLRHRSAVGWLFWETVPSPVFSTWQPDKKTGMRDGSVHSSLYVRARTWIGMIDLSDFEHTNRAEGILCSALRGRGNSFAQSQRLFALGRQPAIRVPSVWVDASGSLGRLNGLKGSGISTRFSALVQLTVAGLAAHMRRA